MAAAVTLADSAAEAESQRSVRRVNAILPPLDELAELSKKIAFTVARTAQQQGLAIETDDDTLRDRIERHFWTPTYREYRRIAARAR